MERSGIADYIDGAKYDSLGELTYFRGICNKIVANLVENGKWFAFGKVADPSQVDILAMWGEKGRIGSMVSDCFPDTTYKQALYKYMLHEYMCYFESPIVKREQDLNGFRNAFNKYVVTSNLGVVAEWLGISYEEAQSLYGQRLYGVDEDTGEDEYPYVKLYVAKTGERKVTKPKTDLNLGQGGIRLVPMFALKTGVDCLYKKLMGGTYSVKFLKDSGQERVINTTFDKQKVLDLYKNEEFVNRNWDGVYSGSFLGNSSMERGYIRVFELGSSIYNNPDRSINYARIVSFWEEEPNMSFMYIDLDSVLQTFTDALYSRRWKDDEVGELVDTLDMFEVGDSREVLGKRIETISQIENWAVIEETKLSTEFLRELAMFMIANQKWFEGYTGQPKGVTSSGVGKPEEGIGSGSEDGLNIPVDGFDLDLDGFTFQ